MSNDEEPHYTSPPSPVVRNLKCVDAESYKTAEALLDDLLELAKERDEARREVCSMNETGLRMNESDKKREAKRRGWDCFKENTND